MYKAGAGGSLYCYNLILCKSCGAFTLHTKDLFGEHRLAFPIAKVLKDILQDLYDIVSTRRIQGYNCLARARFFSVRCA
jgi:hypothetical protein